MAEALQARARAFLDRPAPETAEFVPDSQAEALIAAYAKSGAVKRNADQLDLCAYEAEQAAAAARDRNPEEAAHFAECAALLRAIAEERPTG